MNNEDQNEFLAKLEAFCPPAWCARLRTAMNNNLQQQTNLTRWQQALQVLPESRCTRVDFQSDAVTAIGEISEEEKTQIVQSLMDLHPWRKGPFHLLGIRIDTEWQSNMKWDRIRQQIDLHDKTVVDVGSGNGYYGYRMLGAGAKLVCGLDPFLCYVMQFLATRRIIGPTHNFVLPVGDEVLEPHLECFDVACSLGVLYHRRSPLDHLLGLCQTLRPGGQLVVETLIVEGVELLVPEGRYAKMRNVWFIPSIKLLETWLKRLGLEEVQIVDVSVTTTVEQRKTPWMHFESLTDFLDPDHPGRTIEGYPAPIRAVAVARKRY